MTEPPITKLDAARRQLDSAIKLFFDNEDSLSVHTLAYASFKILFDIYPLHKSDDFATKIDEMIHIMGWQRFNETANFLKHADRDPGECCIITMRMGHRHSSALRASCAVELPEISLH